MEDKDTEGTCLETVGEIWICIRPSFKLLHYIFKNCGLIYIVIQEMLWILLNNLFSKL